MSWQLPMCLGATIVCWAAFASVAASKAAEPADPDLIPAARTVLEYLKSVQGKKILTGISGSQDAQPQAVLHMTGREPAIAGGDVAGFHRKWDQTYRQVMQGTVDRSIRWWREKGGIVALQYHWMKPGDPEGSAWVDRPRGSGRLDLAKAITPGTDEHRAVIEDLKVTADYLQQLADARVPVLWRPLHEIDGGWFWWTDPQTPENTAALWRLMFDYFVRERQLHNLIWVYNAAHVIYNVVALAKDSDGLVACSNVVRLTVGLQNLARSGKATASTTSQHGGPPEAAIDGDSDTMWWSDHEKPDPQWLMVDLGSVRKVGGAMVAWWKAYAKNYTVEVSTDGQT